MATTRLISMHQNKGKSIANCLADRIDYALNPDKTNDGEYVSSYECDPKIVLGEFLLYKRINYDITGRKQENDEFLTSSINISVIRHIRLRNL